MILVARSAQYGLPTIRRRTGKSVGNSIGEKNVSTRTAYCLDCPLECYLLHYNQ